MNEYKLLKDQANSAYKTPLPTLHPQTASGESSSFVYELAEPTLINLMTYASNSGNYLSGAVYGISVGTIALVSQKDAKGFYDWAKRGEPNNPSFDSSLNFFSHEPINMANLGNSLSNFSKGQMEHPFGLKAPRQPTTSTTQPGLTKAQKESGLFVNPPSNNAPEPGK